MDYYNVTYLTLEGHVELEKYRYVYFVMVLTLYLLIISCNGLVIFVIFTNKCLHEPMYIFIAALLCNALYGLTALYPKLLIDFLSEIQIVSYEACIFQSFFIYTYAISEFTLLSAMAYDRYVSICKPLQYATIIKMSTVKRLLFCCWCVPCCENSIALTLTFQVKLCRFKLNRIYCNNSSVVKLSCGDISVRNSYALFIFLCCISISDILVINNRLESDQIPHIFTMIMSVKNLVIPPLLNPIIYGLKMQKIFNYIWSYLQLSVNNAV
ncbi:olfactory receptor 10J4-like [Ictalurus furcatus]|uniref:olfactory receptor 10J4-like n=1 Tax=Ictalurus furcatus TaxID=66913 RepID=UPI002350C7D2|nr:olfactory receptor 10J4-like [Ictalurus furcatus]